MTEVKARDGKEGKEATIIVDLGDNLTDASTKFGEEVVFSNYLANAKISVQSGIRRYIKAGLDNDAIQAKFDTYKPGVTIDRVVDPIATLAAKLMKMSPEEREVAFASLRAKLAGSR